MGAQITAPVENRVLIDWFAWTLKVVDPLEAIKLSGLDFLSFTETKGGGMGYKSTLRSGNIVVFYDGSADMGCHISMSGEGCRQYEGHKQTEHCWYQLLHVLAAINANITRIDIAIDNVDGDLCLDKLEHAISTKEVRTRFKGGHKIEKFSLTDDPEHGRTIYLGSSSSRLKFRFYDKAAQYHIDGVHWVRCEMQLMSERAQEAAKHLLKGMIAGDLAVRVLNNYFTPINLDDTNKTRCTTQTWWESWLQSSEKMKLVTAKALRLVPQVIDHLRRQYSASVALCREFLGAAEFREFVLEMVTTGKEKMTKKHRNMLFASLSGGYENTATVLPF